MRAQPLQSHARGLRSPPPATAAHDDRPHADRPLDRRNHHVDNTECRRVLQTPGRDADRWRPFSADAPHYRDFGSGGGNAPSAVRWFAHFCAELLWFARRFLPSPLRAVERSLGAERDLCPVLGGSAESRIVFVAEVLMTRPRPFSRDRR